MTRRLSWSSLCAALCAIAAASTTAPGATPAVGYVPSPVPPVYSQVKDLHLTTTLVTRGQPRVTVVAPASGLYDSLSLRIQSAMERITGITVAIAPDGSAAGAMPIQGNLILLGNRSTNAAIGRLYDLFHCFLDLKYPGPGGYNVRTLHSPFGDGRNVIFVGASDTAGMEKAATAFLARLDQAGGGPGELSVGHLMDIELSAEPRAEGLKHWDDGRQGAYGWNVVSEHMAMYYMTGRETHAREMLRYAFPDARTREALREKEFIDYHDSPLAQGWDYNSHLMVLLWDLIEESPAFSPEERLRVTNALARQLLRLRNEGVYDRPLDAKVTGNDMHASYSALGLHTLGRYFEKDYPDPIWRHCLRAAHRYYTSFHEDARFAEGTDNLEWYNTTIQPVLTYLILTGWREPLETGALQRLLRAQEALLSGPTHDSALDWASLALFNKAAYLTQDGRWAVYRDRTGLDTGAFRLGQSFWPEERLRPAPPLDLVGQWNVYEMPEAHRRARGTGFAPGQAFYFGSFRSAADATGDFILVDGYNGEARNPYHAFSVNELRLDGHTVLQGYRNQVLTSADGVVEPAPAMDAALEHATMTGGVAVVAAEVPRSSWATWRRVLAQRVGRYALLADEVTFRASSENMTVETLWETPSAGWRADEADWSQLDGPRPLPPVARDTWHAEDDYLEIATVDAGAHVFELRMSDVLEYRRDPVARLSWHGRASPGDRQTRFSLIARRAGPGRPLACIRVAPNAAALALPETALAVAGSHGVTSGKLAVVAESHLFGHDLVSAGVGEPVVAASQPVDVAWDFMTGSLEIATGGPTDITVRTDASRRIQLDGRPLSVEPVSGGSRFRLSAGRHRITGARLTRDRLGTLAIALRRMLESGKLARARSKQADVSRSRAPLDGHSLRPVFTTSVELPIADLQVAPANGGSVLHVAAGKVIHRLAPDGSNLAPFTADGDVRVLHWWPEHRLVLAGSIDNQVTAFEQDGRRRWTFALQMDPGFYGPGDDGPFTWLKYWPALTGVHGLYTATFLDGKPQAFVGSTNTLTIIDEHGTLVKRFPVLRGMVHKFTSFPRETGRTTLLLARQPSDWDTLTVIDNVDLTPQPEGFHDLPPGHKVTWAWMQNRPVYLTSTDLDRDGVLEVVAAIDGVWNRVSTWRTDGTPRCSINFPPGESPLYRNLPGVDVGDLDGDGRKEIVVATAGRVLVALGHDCALLWSQRLRATPTTLTIVPESSDGGPVIVVGDESGSVLIFDRAGRLVQHGRVEGRPTHTALLPRDDRAPMVIIGTDDGRLAAFAP